MSMVSCLKVGAKRGSHGGSNAGTEGILGALGYKEFQRASWIFKAFKYISRGFQGRFWRFQKVSDEFLGMF